MIMGAQDIRSTVCKFHVSGLIILHSYRFPIVGRGRYGGSYGGFGRYFDRVWVPMRRRLSGRHACVRACTLKKHALMHMCRNLRRALGACLWGRQARMSARLWV